MARCRLSSSSTSILRAAAGALLLVAMMAPLAHAQGGLFIQRLPIQPSATGYFLPFDQTQTLAGGTFQRNNISLSSVTTPQTIITINTCGILSPHFHPRGTEQLFVVSGQAEVVMYLEGTTAPDTPIRRVPLLQNQAVILPAGSVHYTRNTGSKPLVLIQTFDNPLAGTVFISNVLATYGNQEVDARVFNTALPGLNLAAKLTPAPALFLLTAESGGCYSP